jgi:broad specificity phosphatase PhoE
MIIHLVRHGEPQMGADGLYVPNAGLTERGNRQAAQAAGHMATLKPEAVFTSTLPRAIETAAHYSRISNQAVRQISDLAELNGGNVWDAPVEIIERITSGDYSVDFKSLGGESIPEFSARAIEGFVQLVEAGVSGGFSTIAAFLHEGVIGTIIDHLEGRSTFDYVRRETMPFGALVTIDTESSAPYFPGYWYTDHLEEVKG